MVQLTPLEETTAVKELLQIKTKALQEIWQKEGLKEGFQKVRQEGLQKGRQEGTLRGKLIGKIHMAQRVLKRPL